jgi:hypothetical protein
MPMVKGSADDTVAVMAQHPNKITIVKKNLVLSFICLIPFVTAMGILGHFLTKVSQLPGG